MDDAFAMGLVERIGNLESRGQHLIERQRAFLQALGEGLAFQVLHDEEVDPVLAPTSWRVQMCG